MSACLLAPGGISPKLTNSAFSSLFRAFHIQRNNSRMHILPSFRKLLLMQEVKAWDIFGGKWTLPSWYYRWKWAHKNVKHYLSRLHYANKHCAAVAPNTWYYFVCTSKVKAEVHDTRMGRHWALLFRKSNSFVLLTQGQSILFPLFAVPFRWFHFAGSLNYSILQKWHQNAVELANKLKNCFPLFDYRKLVNGFCFCLGAMLKI